ncbi:MAG: TAXI family TRAP transporter solute-binding subunit [Thermodesulfobacteriota bacterium]|jgi:uncharacterized protein
MMTGPTGGSWIPLGGAIADAIQKEIPGVTMSVAPGGGITNVEALESGKCDIGVPFHPGALKYFKEIGAL